MPEIHSVSRKLNKGGGRERIIRIQIAGNKNNIKSWQQKQVEAKSEDVGPCLIQGPI